MKDEIRTSYNFSVKNVNFFKNALALLNVDDNKNSMKSKKSINNSVELDNYILFNLFYEGLMLRSLSKCKQIYCFLFIDSNCFASYDIFEKEAIGTKLKKNENNNVKKKKSNIYNGNYYDENESISINSDDLFTTHAIDNENKEVIKLKSVSPFKVQYTENEKNEYDIRKKIYQMDNKIKNSVEFLVSPYKLLSALEFLNPVILNIKFDYIDRKLILHLTDEDGDTSETFISIIVDYYYQIYKLEKHTFLNNDYTYFILQSTIFSFYLEYLIKYNDDHITFHISPYVDDKTSILKIETKNKNYQRSVNLMPKENFEDFKIIAEQKFSYRVRDLSKIPQALNISSYIRLDVQENGVLRLQFTLK
ncbi:conserved Plasmodium protein, unknown function [Plasmodium vinckei vinckei]|uniref:Uncharacterized protein n=1 Tax=Plasmodium vinckei vinckei TaxID=54757 RepID=A0A449BXW5_PLAVN|nr:conserved Plasmodium protein, unknown function [Plasmodium vinckei vinckei]VEV58325.1 conserved Plasmodium protein, unknown function [Plasmodium vinckei vinckei]